MTVTTDELKRQAGEYATLYIRSGMIVGLGAGTTCQWTLQKIAALIGSGDIAGIRGVPCSLRTGAMARELGIPLVDKEFFHIDLTIDGADEVNESLDLIKGGGGALFREKIVAQASSREIIVVDGSKIAPVLSRPVPVEVAPFGWQSQARFIESLGGTPRVRENAEGGAWLTDQGNMVLDCDFGKITRPGELAAILDKRTGIVGHGLFIGMADEVIVADESGIRILSGNRIPEGAQRP